MRLTLDDLRVAESTARQYPYSGGFAGYKHWYSQVDETLGFSVPKGPGLPCNCIIGSVSAFRGEVNVCKLHDPVSALINAVVGKPVSLLDPDEIRAAAPYLATIIRCAEMTAETEKRGTYAKKEAKNFLTAPAAAVNSANLSESSVHAAGSGFTSTQLSSAAASAATRP